MRKYICEAMGTMFLTFIACGVAVITTSDVLATSLSFGLVLLIMCYTIGDISGCHINPAVSLSMLLTKKITFKEFIGYIISQFLGAIIGSLLLATLTRTNELLGANSYGGLMLADTALIALLVEVILTFLFILVILVVTNKKQYSSISGFIIGLALMLVHLIGIPFTGTSVNPARSLAPALLQPAPALAQVWVFIVGPFIGSILATLFYKFILAPKKS